jgi:alkanesulfonate monooxygenase SsuD/methylene tetrahydromethanopterin reductase-like flavin-dependent oxidoreductase (luciferase family)
MSAAVAFGLSGSGGGLEGAGPTPPLELARWAEGLGFDCLWFNEEHFARTAGRGRPLLSPVVQAMAVAAVTSRLRVGFSVLLVPLHHPLRLAEELATLDVLSDGRVNLGLSRANSERYAGAFGYDRATGPSLEDCLDAMICYWTGAPIEVDGVEYQVSPEPVQRPYPPVFIGAYSETTLTWAAERGFPIMQHGIQSPQSLDRCLTSYAAAGGDLSRVPVGRFCYVGASDAAARAEAGDVVAGQATQLYDIGLWRRGDQIITEAHLEPERFARETAIVGGPETVAGRITELCQRYGVRYINLLSSFFGSLPESLLRPSLERFAHEVMPRVIADVGTAAPAAATPTSAARSVDLGSQVARR